MPPESPNRVPLTRNRDSADSLRDRSNIAEVQRRIDPSLMDHMTKAVHFFVSTVVPDDVKSDLTLGPIVKSRFLQKLVGEEKVFNTVRYELAMCFLRERFRPAQPVEQAAVVSAGMAPSAAAAEATAKATAAAAAKQNANLKSAIQDVLRVCEPHQVSSALAILERSFWGGIFSRMDFVNGIELTDKVVRDLCRPLAHRMDRAVLWRTGTEIYRGAKRDDASAILSGDVESMFRKILDIPNNDDLRGQLGILKERGQGWINGHLPVKPWPSVLHPAGEPAASSDAQTLESMQRPAELSNGVVVVSRRSGGRSIIPPNGNR